MLPNRIAIYLTAAGDLVAALAPFILDFGGSEKIAAYVASILGVNAVVVTWLQGWHKYEERTALEPLIDAQLGVAAPGEEPSPVPPTLRRS